MYINGVLQAVVDFEKTATNSGIMRKAVERYKSLPYWAKAVGEPLLAGGAGAGIGYGIADKDNALRAAIIGGAIGAGGALAGRHISPLINRINKSTAIGLTPEQVDYAVNAATKM